MNDILLKYFTGDISEQEKTNLLREVQHDANLKKEFVRLQNIYALSQISTLATNKEEGKDSFKRFEAQVKHKKQRQIIATTLRYAAVAIVLIASTFFITHYIYNSTSGTELNSLYVPAGQRAQLTLEDGSTVWLNANSTIKYPSHFSKKRRHVSIEGEAFFDIAQNKKSPFVVSTKDVELKVLGTQFNVHSYPETNFVKTNLLEGSLRIYKQNAEDRGVTLKPNEQLTMEGNQMKIGKTENRDYFLWTEGVYAFDNERLIDIIEKLQLYYDVKIIVEDPEIFNVRYTGKFRQRDGIDEILRIIQKIRKFNMKKDTENNIITLTK